MTDTDTKPDLRDLLIQARIKGGLTQREFARQTGITPQLIHHYEKGNKKPFVINLHKMLDKINELTGTNYSYKDFD